MREKDEGKVKCSRKKIHHEFRLALEDNLRKRFGNKRE